MSAAMTAASLLSMTASPSNTLPSKGQAAYDGLICPNDRYRQKFLIWSAQAHLCVILKNRFSYLAEF
jgi:hypothetical protein